MIGLVAGTLAASLGGLVLLHTGPWIAFNLAATYPVRRSAVRSRPTAFAVVVPAHNEEALIARCLESIRADRFDPLPHIVVVADNCTDSTAAVARDFGVDVIARDDPARRGKAYALRAGVACLESLPRNPDAVVFIDADNVIAPGFFEAHAAALAKGAAATQAYYGALPPGTHLGNLRSLALRLLHWSRPLGASRLGLGTGIKGSGMAFRPDVVHIALRGEGLAEDAAMTLHLALEGHAIAFVPRARVFGHFAGAYGDARVQDERWERGRLGLIRRAFVTAAIAARRRRLAAAAGALEVATLPLSLLLLASLVATASAALAGGGLPRALGLAAPLSILLYVATGLFAARPPLRELASLVSAPRFVLHKLLTYRRILRTPSSGWERTRRA